MGANVSVNFDTLRSAHPNSHEIKSKVSVPEFIDETCTVQLSYALNHAGSAITNYEFADAQLAEGKVRAYQADDGMNYIYAVPDAKVYLNNRYGDAENYKGSKESMKEKITGRHGIIAFGHRHIDLWEGTRFHWQQLYLDLWGFTSVKKRGIFFWEVTSEFGF